MAVAALDTTVLYAAADASDERHDDALPIIRGIDDGSLPVGDICEFVLAETLNGVVRNLAHESAVDYLDRIEGNGRLTVSRLTAAAFTTGKAVFRRRQQLSLVDGLIVGSMRDQGLEYLYSFDSGFDSIDDVTRLTRPENPFQPG